MNFNIINISKQTLKYNNIIGTKIMLKSPTFIITNKKYKSTSLTKKPFGTIFTYDKNIKNNFNCINNYEYSAYYSLQWKRYINSIHKEKMANSDWADRRFPDTICLFDVDGTLTPARRTVSDEMMNTLIELKKNVVIGFVGGSDLSKQFEQLGPNAVEFFDFAFAENGLTAFRKSVQLPSQSFIKWMGEEKYQKLVNFILHYIADLEIPIKRGTFVEFRNGMINVSPIGRNCTHPERNEFEKYDKEHHIREKFVQALKDNFPDYGLTYSIGGQISFDVFPTGWDKTFCLQHVEKEGFKNIHFFGDKTMKGGNDYEIYTSEKTIGHSVKCPEDTMKELRRLFIDV